jgi:hypothetical protein
VLFPIQKTEGKQCLKPIPVSGIRKYIGSVVFALLIRNVSGTNRGNIIPIIPDGLPDILFGHLRLRVFQRNRHSFLQTVRLRKAHVKTIAHDVWFLSFTNKKQAHPKMSLPECLQIMNCTNAGLRLSR